MTRNSNKLETFERRLAEAIDSGGLLRRNQSVLVGVSGGPDSVALLHGLVVLAGREGRNYTLTAGHLDHGLRRDSAADADFVADLARRWGIEFIMEHTDAGAQARREGEGLEQAGRTVRYDFLQRAAAQCGAQAVALGHHADDNAETILFRILRGTALRGLSGMKPSRPLGNSGVRLIRPMLGVRRCEVLDYCRRAGLAWREDHTNADTAYRRNFIRHELLPLMRERINPQADEALLRLGAFAAQVEEFLVRQAEELLSRSVSHEDADRILIDVTIFAAAAPVIRATACRVALERLGAPQRDLTAEHLAAMETLLNAPDETVNLPGQFHALRRRNQLIISGPGGRS